MTPFKMAGRKCGMVGLGVSFVVLMGLSFLYLSSSGECDDDTRWLYCLLFSHCPRACGVVMGPKTHPAEKRTGVYPFRSKHKISVLVTGGAGFIGYNLAAHLHRRGDTVVVLDNFNDYYSVVSVCGAE